jgi:aminopeptidase N
MFTSRLFELAADPSTEADQQLAFVNSLTGSVLEPDQVETLRGWLTGSAPLPGLIVDTDLRWRLLQALVAHDAAGLDEIEAALTEDPTATGQRHAERTRALRPSADVKAEAWRRAVHDDELPNAINEAIIAGFSHPAQKELLASYVTRYFADVADVWARRSSERAQPVALGLYPSWRVAESTVSASDEWLADESHPPALRRLVSEGRAGILRALAARTFDGR